MILIYATSWTEFALNIQGSAAVYVVISARHGNLSSLIQGQRYLLVSFFMKLLQYLQDSCALLWNLHSLPFLLLSLWGVNFKTKHTHNLSLKKCLGPCMQFLRKRCKQQNFISHPVVAQRVGKYGFTDIPSSLLFSVLNSGIGLAWRLFTDPVLLSLSPVYYERIGRKGRAGNIQIEVKAVGVL